MDSDRRRTPNSNQKKRSARKNQKTSNGDPRNGLKGVKGKVTVSKASVARADSYTVSDMNLGTKTPEETSANGKTSITASKQDGNDSFDCDSLVLDKESNQDKEEASDTDTAGDSVSSQGEEKDQNAFKRNSSGKGSVESGIEGLDGDKGSTLQCEFVQDADMNSTKSCSEPSSASTEDSSESTLKYVEFPDKLSLDTSETNDLKPSIDEEEVHVLDEASNGTQSAGSEDEAFSAKVNGVHTVADLEHKIEEMEMRIEKIEEELREVAALEISLYSVVPEHGNSVHKVHAPARRLSRLYIHACKNWTQDRRGTIAKNAVSGLIMIARSCSNDVPRLTFWLSNTIVLREIISQAFRGSRNSSPFTRFAESNGITKSTGRKPALKSKGTSNNKATNGFMQVVNDWKETGTFIGALEKIESWIFSRIVESIWWQALTPYMLSPDGNSSSSRITGRLLGPALGDHQQGNFSIDLWRNAFQDAFCRLCPVRAGGHECGCLPVLARMVMRQCLTRLDVAMFNAILRESAHEIPTDPVSDPIVDSKVLPISAGHLSFGSGAQLKNSVGNWSRWITDALGVDADDIVSVEHRNEDECRQNGDSDLKSFTLLNELSDLLMLPKDMLMDRSIRKEVCPSISLTLVKRILCNFTPDEFCPDAVPGAVLEALNAESIMERRISGETTRNFPYTAALVVYSPPSSAIVAEKVVESGGRSSPLSRSMSIVERKGYTSDEELQDLDSPLTSIIDNLHSSPTSVSNGNGKGNHVEHDARAAAMNARYELLREVWSG